MVHSAAACSPEEFLEVIQHPNRLREIIEGKKRGKEEEVRGRGHNHFVVTCLCCSVSFFLKSILEATGYLELMYALKRQKHVKEVETGVKTRETSVWEGEGKEVNSATSATDQGSKIKQEDTTVVLGIFNLGRIAQPNTKSLVANYLVSSQLNLGLFQQVGGHRTPSHFGKSLNPSRPDERDLLRSTKAPRSTALGRLGGVRRISFRARPDSSAEPAIRAIGTRARDVGLATVPPFRGGTGAVNGWPSRPVEPWAEEKYGTDHLGRRESVRERSALGKKIEGDRGGDGSAVRGYSVELVFPDIISRVLRMWQTSGEPQCWSERQVQDLLFGDLISEGVKITDGKGGGIDAAPRELISKFLDRRAWIEWGSIRLGGQEERLRHPSATAGTGGADGQGGRPGRLLLGRACLLLLTSASEVRGIAIKRRIKALSGKCPHQRTATGGSRPLSDARRRSGFEQGMCSNCHTQSNTESLFPGLPNNSRMRIWVDTPYIGG
ncbi:hypothetical protein DFH09DRAFT_1082715 [Mycena vulgaris]|nr:hypothetical protein DFH09DRAFT_1082715 [Mycena vulgaris]